MLKLLFIFQLITFSILSYAQNNLGPTFNKGSSWKKESHWKQVLKLENEQKYQKALETIEIKLKQFQRNPNKNEKNITISLLKKYQLLMALGKAETALISFNQESFGKSEISRVLKHLYYAQLLKNYFNTYSWEINQRQHVQGKISQKKVKQWSKLDITNLINRSFNHVWKLRDSLGDTKISYIGEFLNQGNYPEGIRESLREGLTYFFTDHLKNTQFWSSKQLNSKNQFELKRLLKIDQTNIFEIRSQEAHPLLKIIFLFSDLSSWLKKIKKKDAELEAYLERVRVLKNIYTSEDDKAVFLKALKNKLNQFTNTQWWSEGKYLKASLLDSMSYPLAKIDALREAQEGYEFKPSSLGGKRCKYIIEKIKAPDLFFSALRWDLPKRKSIELKYKNLDHIYFRAYRYNPEPYLLAQTRNALPSSYDDILLKINLDKFDFEWSQELQKTKDYQYHKVLIAPQIKTKGFYIVVASPLKIFERSKNKLSAFYFNQTELKVLQTKLADGTHFKVINPLNSNVVKKALLTVYKFDWNKGHSKVGRFSVDDKGEFVLKKEKFKRDFRYSYSVAHKDDYLLDEQLIYNYPHNEQTDTYISSLIFTDRSIYRPGQKIHFKILSYTNHARKGELPQIRQKQKLTMTLRDYNGEEVESIKVTTNEFGTAAGEFSIPHGRTLGQWQIRVDMGEYRTKTIQVEEYKRPTFKITMESEKGEQRIFGEKVQVKGKAEYYLGTPLKKSKVKFKITKTPQYPHWYYWWYPHARSNLEIVKSGESITDNNGKFEIEFTPQINQKDNKFKQVIYAYQVEIEIINAGGETIRETASLNVGKIGITGRIESKNVFAKLENKKPQIKLFLSDLNGRGLSGNGKISLYKIKVPKKIPFPADFPKYYGELKPVQTEYHTKDDFKRSRNEYLGNVYEALNHYALGKKQFERKIVHDESGKGELSLGSLAPGAYRIIYTSLDKNKNQYKTNSNFIILGKKTKSHGLPILVETSHQTAKPGEKIKFYIASPYQGQKIFIQLSNKKRIIKKLMVKNNLSLNHQITKEDLGGVYLQAYASIDNSFLSRVVRVGVPYDHKKLNITYESLRKITEPGKKENFKIKIKPKSKNETEILAYMYDQSLDSFVSHQPENIFNHFPSARLRPMFGEIYFQNRIYYSTYSWITLPSFPYLNPGRLQVLDSYPIGGMGRRGRSSGISKMRFAKKVSKQEFAPAMEAEAVRGDISEFKENNVKRDNVKNSVDKKQREEAPTNKLRSNFSETAFFFPQLKIDHSGEMVVSYQVPDSLTSWNLWTVAHNRKLDFAQFKTTLQTQKKLMVRSYIPRFFREDDQVDVNFLIENLSDMNLKGKITINIEQNGRKINHQFQVEKKFIQGHDVLIKKSESKKITIPLQVPHGLLGNIKITVKVKAGNYTDGEERELPILPSRMHLFQSKFITLKDKESRSIEFKDMLKPDRSRIDQKLVVSVDAQLYFSLLAALPYLVDFPYECSEQTLNRFVSTSILKSIYDKNPSLKKMAKNLKKRSSQYESFNQKNPNRTMSLEETPWLVNSRGGGEQNLLNTLDPKVVKVQVADSLRKLKNMQTSSGGFPWFPGGRPSVYMTNYILYGFSKASEFSVAVPRNVIEKAFRFLKNDYRATKKICMESHGCFEKITFLNYILSNFKDQSVFKSVFSHQERVEMLDFSFAHWKKHQPQLKGMLALTLKRFKRDQDAVLVLESILDSAKQEKDLGVYWAPEDRSWLWYNDTIETQAMTLRAILEVLPQSKLTDGLVQWLFLNKKLNQWKSTRATAEVIYSVTKYLQAKNLVVADEELSVKIDQLSKDFKFSKTKYSGKNNFWELSPPKFNSSKMNKVEFKQKSGGMMFASAVWHYSTTKNPKSSKGDFFQIERNYFLKSIQGDKVVLIPLKQGQKIKVGDEVEVHLSIRSKHAAEYVHVRDPRPAGFEPLETISGYKWNLGLSWYQETRDSSSNFFFENIPVGEYTLKFSLRAALSGSFKALPAKMESVYAPEFKAHSAGESLSIQ